MFLLQQICHLNCTKDMQYVICKDAILCELSPPWSYNTSFIYIVVYETTQDRMCLWIPPNAITK